MHRYRKALTSLLLATSSVPTYCAGTSSVLVSTPAGDYGVILAWQKDNENASMLTVTTTVPPQMPASVIEVEGRSVELPANESEHPWPVTIEVKDPIILQVPAGWTIAEARVITAAGSGDVVVVPGTVPSAVAIHADGTASLVDAFVAEPGYELYFLDMPAGLWAQSEMSGFLRFHIPLSERRVDSVKFIETWRVDATSPTGQLHTCFAPIGPATFDFAEVTDLAHAFVIDATAPPCSGPNGSTPTMALPNVDWNIGAATSVDACDLDPQSLGVFLWGGEDLPSPVSLPLSLSSSGCRLRIHDAGRIPAVVDAAGRASVAVAVPPTPALVGAALVWQVAEVHPSSTDIVTGTVMKVRVEP